MVPGPRPHVDELDSIPRHPEEMLDLIYGGPSDSEKGSRDGLELDNP